MLTSRGHRSLKSFEICSRFFRGQLQEVSSLEPALTGMVRHRPRFPPRASPHRSRHLLQPGCFANFHASHLLHSTLVISLQQQRHRHWGLASAELSTPPQPLALRQLREALQTRRPRLPQSSSHLLPVAGVLLRLGHPLFHRLKLHVQAHWRRRQHPQQRCSPKVLRCRQLRCQVQVRLQLLLFAIKQLQ